MRGFILRGSGHRADPGEGLGGRRRVSLRAVVHLVVAVLVVMLVGSAAVTGAARATVAGAQRTLSERVLPSRQASSDLATAYLDQETGQRGFLLTGDPAFLEPYDRGIAAADRLHRRLTDLLSDDAGAAALLEAVRIGGQRWRSTVAQAGIEARRAGILGTAEVDALAVEGKAQFDALRTRLDALEERTVELTTAQFARIRQAQLIANVIAVSAAVLAVGIGMSTWLFLRRRLGRPLDRLLTDVQAVAHGDHEHHIDRSGPRELSLLADSVDRMRSKLVDSGRARAAAQHELTLRQEQDRMAADLHDLTMQRVYAVGLRLDSAARRHPQLAPVVAPLIEETDRINRELRTVILNLNRIGTDPHKSLRDRVIDVVGESARALGFTPTVTFFGPIDDVTSEQTAGEVLAVLRESLSNVARHAQATAADVCLRIDGGSLLLTVRDNGVGVDPAAQRGNGLANLQARAARLGGSSTIGTGPGGTGSAVDWRVPLTHEAG